jgi:hypothetical protein
LAEDRPNIFIDYEEKIQLEVRSILASYPRLVMEKKQRFSADSFIIATAKVHGLTVVTEERPANSLNRPNVPDVCRDMPLEWIS